MHFFPHAVKQPLLGMEVKRERKEEYRKFKQSSNMQNAFSHWPQNYLDCKSKESIYR